MTCPQHAPCYISHQYMPFHGPCMACMTWFRAIANERLDDDLRAYAIFELKEFFKKLLRINKSKAVIVVACADEVILTFLKCPKGKIPNVNDLAVRLKAVRLSIDDEFPDLPSPVSVRSFTPSTTSDLPYAYSQVVSGTLTASPREQVAGTSAASQPKAVVSEKTAALNDEPVLGESSSAGVDVIENPLIKQISDLLNVRFASYERTLGSLIEKVAVGEKDIADLRQQASERRIEREERDSSPAPQPANVLKRKHEASPPFSPKKRGLEFATDQRKAIRRGRVEVSCTTPGRSREPREEPRAPSPNSRTNVCDDGDDDDDNDDDDDGVDDDDDDDDDDDGGGDDDGDE